MSPFQSRTTNSYNSSKLRITPVYRVESHRISYELRKIDFDIDTFPEIPPFVEIDLEHLDEDINELLKKLELTGHEIFTGSTIELFSKYDKNYEELFKL